MKLDKKQMPLFVVLCLVSAGMLGYALYSLLGKGASRPASAGTSSEGSSAAVVLTTPPEPAAGMPQLAPSFRSDPFRPAVSPDASSSSPVKTPPIQIAVHEAPMPAPELEAALKAPPPPVITRPAPVLTPALPPVPAGPVRPALVVTGILDGASPVAILKQSDKERFVVQERDPVTDEYVVDEITANAVVLVAGDDRWRLFLED